MHNLTNLNYILRASLESAAQENADGAQQPEGVGANGAQPQDPNTLNIEPQDPINTVSNAPDANGEFKQSELGRAASIAANTGASGTGEEDGSGKYQEQQNENPEGADTTPPAPVSEQEPGDGASEGELNLIPADTERLLGESIAEGKELSAEGEQISQVEAKVEDLQIIVDEVEAKAEEGELTEASMESYNRLIGAYLRDLKLDGTCSVGFEDAKVDTTGIKGLLEKVKAFLEQQKKDLADRTTKWKTNVLTNVSQVRKRAEISKKLVDASGAKSKADEDGAAKISVNTAKLYTVGGAVTEPVALAKTFSENSVGAIELLSDDLLSAYKPVKAAWDAVDFSSNAKVEKTLTEAASKVVNFEDVVKKIGLDKKLAALGSAFTGSYGTREVSSDASDAAKKVVEAYGSLRRLEESDGKKSAKGKADVDPLTLDQAKKVTDYVIAMLDDAISHSANLGGMGKDILPGKVFDTAPTGGFFNALSKDNTAALEALFYTLSGVVDISWSAQTDITIDVANAANELLAWVEKSITSGK
ncbi:hypothetical protein ACLPJK_26395 [Pseudomonas aeruginosa]|uniref:hypothetical protein n=1 Tax=Pseudomonas aeruginosa TaxID=287 RepID=UPI003D2B5E60